MCPVEVLKEIEIRGYKDTYIYDPKKPPTAKDHIHGPKTISEDSFFRSPDGFAGKDKGVASST